MKINLNLAPGLPNRWRYKGWAVCGTALISFVAGSLLTARLTHLHQVRADSNRVFELMVYHTTPGKVPELEPEHPSRLLPRFASEDHLHPNDVGYQAMADAIDLAVFK